MAARGPWADVSNVLGALAACPVELVKDGAGLAGAEPGGQGFQGLDDVRRLLRADLAERGGQRGVDRDQCGAHDVLRVLRADAYERAAAVGGVGKGLDGSLLAQPRDRLGHVALRHTGAGGDLADGTARVITSERMHLI